MYNGYLPRTPFESECYIRGMVPSQVAVALSFGRDMIAEYDASLEDDADCNDNGCGNCHCNHCNGGLPWDDGRDDDTLPWEF